MSERTAIRIALVMCLGSSGCASDPVLPNDFARAAVVAAEESAPLAGNSLAQRRGELTRAYRDLTHFHETLESLDERAERRSLAQMQRFVDGYLGLHVAPLLSHVWQARHPEVMNLDANLRFAHADVLIRMREPSRAQDVIDDVRSRYAGREAMLVEYPFGEQNPLGDALVALQNAKWDR